MGMATKDEHWPYRSNNGAGPYEARIVGFDDERVEMEMRKYIRLNPRKRAGQRFWLPQWFLTSRQCGWSEVKP